MIDAYLTDLRAALRGPRRAKSDLLAEARDHLMEAAEQHQQDGLDQTASEQAATADFGELAEIVPAYQTELDLAQGRRTALGVLLMSAAQPFVWGLGYRWLTGTPDQPHTADEIVEKVGGVTIVVAMLAVLAYRFGMRHPAVRTRLAKVTGVGALWVCVMLASASLLLTAWTGGLLTLVWTVTFVLIPASWVAVSARRCLRGGPQHTVD